MKHRLGKVVLLSLAAAGLVFAPAAAQAERGLYSDQGADYSYDYKSERRIQIHDGESDGRDVKVQYATGASSTRYELFNRSGAYTDAERALSYWPNIHRSVEIINLRPDALGDWVYPS